MVFQKNLVMPGFFEVYCGPMKSGKSRELLNRIDRVSYRDDAKFKFFKPNIDTRNGGIYSRFNNISYECLFIDSEAPEKILDYISKDDKIIAIDEVMMFDKGIVGVVDKLIKQDKNIIAAGLDLDFRGEPFGPMPELLCKADYVEKQYGICEFSDCNNLATRTQKLVNGLPASYNSPLITIEGKDKDEKYECRCINHHIVPKS